MTVNFLQNSNLYLYLHLLVITSQEKQKGFRVLLVSKNKDKQDSNQ